MDQESIISIVDRSGVPYDKPVTRQSEYQFVRFFYLPTARSLNFGFRSPGGPFVTDFVFKGKSRDMNIADLEAFIHLFGGVAGNRATPFARLEPDFADTEWLIGVIQGYWAMGKPLIRV